MCIRDRGYLGNTPLLTWWHKRNIRLTLVFQHLKKCSWPNVGTTTKRWLFFSNGLMRAQHMLADCNILISLNMVRLSLFPNSCVDESQKQVFGRHFVKPFLFIKPVSIKHTCHTNQCYTGTRVVKLLIWMKHFRNNQLISGGFPGENYFLAFVFRGSSCCHLFYCKSWLEWFCWCVVAGQYYFSCLSRLTVRCAFTLSQWNKNHSFGNKCWDTRPRWRN